MIVDLNKILNKKNYLCSSLKISNKEKNIKCTNTVKYLRNPGLSALSRRKESVSSPAQILLEKKSSDFNSIEKWKDVQE